MYRPKEKKENSHHIEVATYLAEHVYVADLNKYVKMYNERKYSFVVFHS